VFFVPYMLQLHLLGLRTCFKEQTTHKHTRLVCRHNRSAAQLCC
jgi:hypothetical protein